MLLLNASTLKQLAVAATWYARGVLDERQSYGDAVDYDDVYRFAELYLELGTRYSEGRATTLPSIQDAWHSYARGNDLPEDP